MAGRRGWRRRGGERGGVAFREVYSGIGRLRFFLENILLHFCLEEKSLSEIDSIGPWSEVKLEILRKYVVPYSRIIRDSGFHHLYIDAFAAGGSHIRRETSEVIQGSPLIALETDPRFCEYHFIDADHKRVQQLRQSASDRTDVHIHEGDCNEILAKEIFPLARWEDRRRALCLLDPYNLDLAWSVVAAAGKMRSIELFVNFMVMDMNMNVLLRNPKKARIGQIARLDRFWGDSSWRELAYKLSGQSELFEDEARVKVEDPNEKIAEAYRLRLIESAGFKYAPRPLPFVNKLGRTIYYLFFASPKATANKIVEDIFKKYRNRQG